MVIAIEAVLALLVLSGCIVMVWGVRRFQLPAQVLAVAFTITAISWVALIITTISFTVRVLMLPAA